MKGALRAPRLTCLLVLGLLAGACGRLESFPRDGGTGVPPGQKAPGSVEPAPPADPDALAGTWWIVFPELPYEGLRLTLEQPAPSRGSWEGSWISFDWRSTRSPSDLARPSRPVAVTARREGDAVRVIGPAPQIDAQGRPNGDHGTWDLLVRRSSLPGEPARHTGRARHPPLTGEGETPVDMSRSFRPYQR